MTNQYENLESVKDDFTSGDFKLPKEIEVNNIKYHIAGGNDQRIDQLYHQGMKAMVVYSLAHEHSQQAKEVGLDDWIVCIWGFEGIDLVRFDVKMTNHRRGATQVMSGNLKEGQNIIGDIVPIGFLNFQNAKAMKGKVDTGATISSLHVDQMQVNKESGQVTFINNELSPNKITLPIDEQQSVKSSDGGTEYRPIVLLNIKLNGQTMEGVQFNLNDRSEMDYPVLIGQNVLEKGGFLIDPRINEDGEIVDDIDWDILQEEFKDVEQVKTTQNQIIEMVRQTMGDRVLKALELEGVVDLTPDNEE